MVRQEGGFGFLLQGGRNFVLKEGGKGGKNPKSHYKELPRDVLCVQEKIPFSFLKTTLSRLCLWIFT